MQVDILGMGTYFNIKGKKSGHYYEGLVYETAQPNQNTFVNKQYVVDIKEASATEVTEIHDILSFEDGNIPVESLKGEKYMIIDGKPRFNEGYTTIEDLKG